MASALPPTLAASSWIALTRELPPSRSTPAIPLWVYDARTRNFGIGPPEARRDGRGPAWARRRGRGHGAPAATRRQGRVQCSAGGRADDAAVAVPGRPRRGGGVGQVDVGGGV